jgi:hypothetical protein
MHSAVVESYLLICDAIEQEKLLVCRLVVPGNLTRVKQRGAAAGYVLNLVQQDRTPDMRRSARKNLIFRNLTGFSSQYRYRISTGTPVKIRAYTCVHSCVCVHIPLYLSRYKGTSAGTHGRNAFSF